MNWDEDIKVRFFALKDLILKVVNEQGISRTYISHSLWKSSNYISEFLKREFKRNKPTENVVNIIYNRLKKYDNFF